jgi:pimeloyl-ACP methyl ester carboxylesterase
MLKPATRGCLATAFLVAAACTSTAQAASQAAAAVTPCTATQAGVCRETLTLARDAKLAYYRTYSLSAPNTQVTKAVLVIHGTDRNALAAFTQVLNAAKATSNVANTIILAPRFPIKEDTPPPGFLYWDRKDGIDHGWKQGDDAISANPMSAFTVADRILRLLNLATRFPNLQQVTVVGHSGGGQYTQRYSLGGKQPSLMRAGITVRYVAANAGSYTYLNGYRPDLADQTYRTWMLPATSCPYNRYKYGLEGLNNYLDDTPPATLVAQYPTRRVTYLLGELDTSRAGTFDSSCQADLQGLHRLERGSAFAAFMDRYHPQHRHQRVVVPGVAHAAGLMFNSPQGRAAIFPASGGNQLRLAG